MKEEREKNTQVMVRNKKRERIAKFVKSRQKDNL
jgi:hypothetical protein